MQEKPLERLNYYNGMAVDAAGFKTEQEYHIRVRRWLNKSLYSAGIASGLEVREAGLGPNVVVSPGLALDSAGREIILLEETTVEVCSYYGGNAAEVVGNYLVIEYGEDAVSWEAGSCAVRSPVSRGAKSTNNGGGPSRVQAIPKFSWVPFVPLPGANQIVLARVELTQDCKGVDQIDPATRRYVGAASAATVRQYALEGEREVAFIPKESFPAQPSTAPQPTDVEVVGRIYFHIRGRQPNAVTLYLKASEFSALHYTEMGTHTHSLSVTGTTQESDPALDEIRTSHFHGSSTMSAVDNDRSKHSTHSLSARKGYIGDHEKDSNGQFTADIAAFFLIERNWGLKFYLPQNTNDFFTNAGAWIADAFTAITHTEPTRAPELDTAHDDILLPTGGVIGEGNHSHDIGGNTDGKGIDLRHKHPISGSGTSGETGVANPLNPASTKARGGTPLTYVSGLQIAINGLDRTTAIQDQIVDSVPGAQKPAWQLGLGNGASNHPLANEAFDAISIRLDFLPHVTFAEGQHVIELSVPRILDGNGNPVPNGGRIHYNLYVE